MKKLFPFRCCLIPRSRLKKRLYFQARGVYQNRERCITLTPTTDYETCVHTTSCGKANRRKSVNNDSRNLYLKAPIQGVRAAYSASEFLSHEVAALGKPRLERSGGLGLVGQRIVKALKGRSSAPRWGFCDVLAL